MAMRRNRQRQRSEIVIAVVQFRESHTNHSQGGRSMNSMTKILGVLVLSVGIMPIPNSAAGNGAEAFEKLKSLVGHWETDKTNMNKATLDLELTSGGTAVLEKFHMVDNGKPVKMTTLYYLDGDQVKLTHYCMAGNQPRSEEHTSELQSPMYL